MSFFCSVVPLRVVPLERAVSLRGTMPKTTKRERRLVGSPRHKAAHRREIGGLPAKALPP